ncbi:hypothetical protein [Arthrobacter sp. zg-Y1110]|uniref:hypothetical protein n=1 Tax=Arthrobacter sp. zg-Y1110 TaxID=2886932 RepID=UPI001D13A3E5|nr:hypothetical protein [Arthrobacter sp. zg-Y1110]MCC3292248.1 hypothetical protein [Arthrobacter sp. zg-Y1110]UWX85330.1 hypothetical protein N2K99_01810 [Arthrobacter sp. zg-Y1110]
MPQRTDPFRLLRAGVATAVIFALATGAHLAGGGMLPEPVLLIALAAFTLAGVSITAGRRFRPGSLFLVLGAAQLGLHEAFGLLTSGVQCLPGASTHHGVAVVCPEAAPLPGTQASLSGLHALQHDAGPALFLAHLAAVALSALVLARGEGALHATAAWLRPLFTPPAPVTFRPVRPPAISGPAAGTPRTRYCSARPLRGPPSYALA